MCCQQYTHILGLLKKGGVSLQIDFSLDEKQGEASRACPAT